MNLTLIYMICIPLLILSVIILKAIKRPTNHFKPGEQTSNINTLYASKLALEQEIEQLKNKVNTVRANNRNDLTKEQEKAWLLYVNNSVMLPYDILEDILYINPLTYDDTVSLIENKRQAWKYELSKKVYKHGN